MNHIPVAKRNLKKYDSVNKKIINEIKKNHIYMEFLFLYTNMCFLETQYFSYFNE